MEDLKKRLTANVPPGTYTVEELLNAGIKKPDIKRLYAADTERLSSTNILLRLGAPKVTDGQARRASNWMREQGFLNYSDKWCWHVEFKDDYALAPQRLL